MLQKMSRLSGEHLHKSICVAKCVMLKYYLMLFISNLSWSFKCWRYFQRAFALQWLLFVQGVDCVIALTHMRWPNDIRLAKDVSEIDLILGGHDHDFTVKHVSVACILWLLSCRFSILPILWMPEIKPLWNSVNTINLVFSENVISVEYNF